MNLQGTTIGHYKVVEQIGRGGMATVYKARQPGLDRYVAIKILPSDLAKTKDFRIRFEREAKTIARLRHRNILTIFEDGQQGDTIYLVMEYVGGGTFQERLGWPQDLAYTINIISQIGDALAHAHEKGIIHRDIKPANILMADEDWPLLSDFGLVKMVEDSLHLTAGGASVGTPHYMSPEQAMGEPADHRSDIYSLGIVLYEAITGQRPYANENPVAVIYKHINESIPPPRSLRSDLPEEVEQVLFKALAKTPKNRYQRMDDFLTDLHQTYPLASAVSIPQSRPPVTSAKIKKQTSQISRPSVASLMPKKHKSSWPKIIMGLFLLLLIIGAVLFFTNSMTPLVTAITNTINTPVIEPQPESASPTATQTTMVAPIVSAAKEQPSTDTGVSPHTPVSTHTPFPPTSTTERVVSPEATTEPEYTAVAVSAATAIPIAIKTRVSTKDGAEMVFIPAGSTLPEFWLDHYEVTNAQFAQFIQNTGYQTEAEHTHRGWVARNDNTEEIAGATWQQPHGPNSNITNKDNHPVVQISWHDALAYCQWADKQLPSEAQWQTAAWGSTADTTYAWGNTFDSTKANTQEAGLSGTAPVGSYSPQGDSPYGAADLTGNVSEWLNPDNNLDENKVVRGGSWFDDQILSRIANRDKLQPDYTYDFVGFRCMGF